jgi:hypothetical protein
MEDPGNSQNLTDNDECTTCIEKFNKKQRKEISCYQCQFKTCVVCCKKYLLGTKEEAHCMNCKKPWDRMFLATKFPKSWLHKEYKIHKEKLIEERHDSSLHQWQPYIVSKRRIKEYETEIKDFQLQIGRIRTEIRRLDLWKRNEQNFVNGSRQTQPDPKDILERRSNKEDDSTLKKEAEERRAKLLNQRGPCPKDSCKGFISDNWECGVCQSKICQSCMIEISPSKVTNRTNEVSDSKTDHKCKKEDVLSTKQIRKDSRNCPKCKVRIFKSSGCNQMFCTNCHVFFDWNTLKIIRTGLMHNPHYTEFMRTQNDSTPNIDQNQLNLRAIPNICGQRNIDYSELSINTTKEPIPRKKYKRELHHILRNVYETMESNREERQRNDMRDLEREFGIKMLEGSLDKDYRRQMLQKKQKEMDKLSDTVDVRELWCDQVYTYIFNFCRNNASIEETKGNISKIDKYCKKAMQDVGSWYNSKAPKIVKFPRY